MTMRRDFGPTHFGVDSQLAAPPGWQLEISRGLQSAPRQHVTSPPQATGGIRPEPSEDRRTLQSIPPALAPTSR
jgi:hypothetical protein